MNAKRIEALERAANSERVAEAPAAFPYFAETDADKALMLSETRAELDAWRLTKAHHYSLAVEESDNSDSRMANRKWLEMAHDVLLHAFRMARIPAEARDAAPANVARVM